VAFGICGTFSFGDVIMLLHCLEKREFLFFSLGEGHGHLYANFWDFLHFPFSGNCLNFFRNSIYSTLPDIDYVTN
jgi:hypothetical protein